MQLAVFTLDFPDPSVINFTLSYQNHFLCFQWQLGQQSAVRRNWNCFSVSPNSYFQVDFLFRRIIHGWISWGSLTCQMQNISCVLAETQAIRMYLQYLFIYCCTKSSSNSFSLLKCPVKPCEVYLCYTGAQPDLWPPMSKTNDVNSLGLFSKTPADIMSNGYFFC